MREYILFLPLIFIFHDMEEILGFGWFLRNAQDMTAKHPLIFHAYRGFNHEGFVIAVYEELILFGGVSVLAWLFPASVLCAVWYGMLLGLTSHFIIHIGICIYLRRFVPSIVTSVICLPVSVYILIECEQFMAFDILTVTVILLTVLILMANLKVLHKVCFAMGERMR